jgi:hypothetical protein
MSKHSWTEEEDSKICNYINLGLTPSKIAKQDGFKDISIGGIKARYEKLKREKKFQHHPATPRNKGPQYYHTI